MANRFAPQRVFLSLLDVRQPNFAHRCIVWAAQTQREIHELVAATKKEIAISEDLLSKVDRILNRR